ncbi:MAG: hypothetical protein MPJ24_07050 [Pirellulaceae bacterium]|nr:hypothetical protein [Pirellulaceae bacterium]
MEHFQWISVEESIALKENQKALDEIGEELADVLSYSLALSNVLGLDLTTILLAKMEKNRTKYPIDQFKGRYGNRQHLAPPQE